jgi:DNA-binding winged helix-turn-helix (wHTH) protein
MEFKPRRRYIFGDFTVDSRTRTLTRDGVAISLFPRCFDMLLYFVENPGRVITKDELLRGVWADAFVEESNLSQNVSLLRKALDDRRQCSASHRNRAGERLSVRRHARR